MKCPVCPDTDLLMSERAGIEIDYCPQCRGVWLDRGELDKIIERSMDEPARTAATSGMQQAHGTIHQPYAGRHGDHGKHHSSHHDHYGHHGRRSFWKELFD